MLADIDSACNEAYQRCLFDARTGLHHRSLRYRAVADAAGNIYQ